MSKKKSKALPKRIGGVKVPKTVRKGRFAAILSSKAGQALIAEALMAAATVVIAKKAKASPKVRAKAHDAAEAVREAGHDKAAKASAASAALTYALGEAVRSFAAALHHGQADTAEAAADPKPKWRPPPKGPLKGAQANGKTSEPPEAAPS